MSEVDSTTTAGTNDVPGPVLDPPAGDAAGAVRRALAAEPADGAVRALIDTVEGRVFDLSRPQALATREDALRLLRSLEALDAVRDHALPRLGERAPDTVAEIHAELAAAGDLLPAGPASPVASVRERVEDRMLARVEAAARAAPPEDRPGEVLDQIGRLRAGLVVGRGAVVLQRIHDARAEAWRRIQEVVAALDGEARTRRLRRLADDINDRAEDTLARAEALSRAEALAALEAARQDVADAAALARRHRERAARRDLRRMAARLRAGAEDRRVRARLEAQVGKRGVAVVDASVTVLIVALLAIFGWLLFGSPSAAAVEVLDVVDAALCALLLAEFSWRWWASGFSGAYLRRSLLTDVLPSIPFGVLVNALHAPAAAADSIEVLRTLRLARLVQGLRLLRPAVQAVRVLAFVLQGMDRFVRRLAPLLNRNIVLFDEPGQEEAGAPTAAVRLANLHDRACRTLRRTLLGLPPAARDELGAERARAWDRRIDAAPAAAAAAPAAPRAGGIRDIRIESLIERLVTLDPSTVVENLGDDGSHRLARILGLLDVPLVRRLPVLRAVVPGLRGLDPAAAVIQAGRRVGIWLDGILDRIRVFADLQGIVTGPQLLDRFGSALVKATQRPAVRLLLFGFLVMVVSAIFGIFGDDRDADSLLNRTNRFLKGVLGTPLLILGGVCLAIQAFGRWIRHIAGEATDLYEKVAEAQGIDLLKFRKLSWRERDLGFLHDRVMAAEAEIADPGRPEARAAERRGFVERPPLDGGFEPAADGGHSAAEEQVRLLYLDYLDGGILHWSNVKSTQQFLGNLDLEAIRVRRLGQPRKEVLRLRRLDVQRERALPTGPYLWFTFITESLAQRTAKLVLEYNRWCVPDAHRRLVPAEAVAAMDAWVSGRRPTSAGERAEDLGVSGALGTRFTALHFLDAEPGRDRRVGTEFGSAVRKRVESDRRNMIRHVFSTYPCQDWPRHRRIFNPHSLYFQWMGRGRVLVLPLRALWVWLRFVGRSFRFLGRVIRDQLRPPESGATPPSTRADRDAAIRKINRMHRPLFLAAVELRARFDPEYLGVPLPGRAASPAGAGTILEDLDLVGARAHEREVWRQARETAAAHRARFESLLREAGWPSRGAAAALDPEGPRDLPPADDAALRAAFIAYVIDYQRCRALLHAEQDLQLAAEAALADTALPSRPRPLRRRAGLAFERWLSTSPFASRDPAQVARLRGAFAAGAGPVRRLVLLLEEALGPEAAAAAGRAVLARAARYPAPWSQQLVTLRTVQSLTCLDILNTRAVVLDLGNYATSEPSPANAPSRRDCEPVRAY